MSQLRARVFNAIFVYRLQWYRELQINSRGHVPLHIGLTSGRDGHASSVSNSKKDIAACDDLMWHDHVLRNFNTNVRRVWNDLHVKVKAGDTSYPSITSLMRRNHGAKANPRDRPRGEPMRPAADGSRPQSNRQSPTQGGNRQSPTPRQSPRVGTKKHCNFRFWDDVSQFSCKFPSIASEFCHFS